MADGVGDARGTRRESVLRWVLSRAAFVTFGLAIGLALLEAALRLAGIGALTHDLRALHEPHPDRPWLYGMRPGSEMVVEGVHYRVNADGFRDRDYARAKPPNTFRIVVLGQSVALGYGVPLEETFAKLLEERLAPLVPDRRVEVLNLSVMGYNTYTEAALFTDVGVTYQPDLVLVQFGFNDLNDPTLHFDNATKARLGKLPDAAFPNRWRYRRPRPSLFARVCGSLRFCTLWVRLGPLVPDRDLLAAATLMHQSISAAEMNWLRARYGEIATAAFGLGARMAIVVIPYAGQMNSRVSDGVQARLDELGRETGWPVIDLLSLLRNASRKGPSPFMDGFHLSKTGNDVVAHGLVIALNCRGLLPVPPGKECH